MQNKLYLQITSGRGPEECSLVVALTVKKIIASAKKEGLTVEVLDRVSGHLNRTLLSATLLIEGENCKILQKEWEGTVLWIAQSPYRVYHKRKNWFIKICSFEVPAWNEIDEKEIVYQALRASGPGGQHVNKTESAVRATHQPSGLSVTASDQRSQFQNKKLATQRLKVKLAAWNTEQSMLLAQQNWDSHNHLQRGNPVKTIKEPLI